MGYSIRSIDIAAGERLEDVNALLRNVFSEDIGDSRLATTTYTVGSRESLYLAAFDGERIVGFNAFISHDLILNGSVINCYQSCWIATCRDHRGKGIFQSLSKRAAAMLIQRGAAFIFCFPNENSRPILVGRLGYREIPSLKWQVPNIPVARDLYLKVCDEDISQLSENVVFQNGRQLVELKRKIYGDELVFIELEESFIWGVTRVKEKFGARLRYFEIGGLSLARSSDLRRLFRRLFDRVRTIHYFQLTTSAGSPFNRFFKYLRPAQTNDLIILDLEYDTKKNVYFNFFGGVKDVF